MREETTATTGTGDTTAAASATAETTATSETSASSATATTETKAAETPSKDATLLNGGDSDKPATAPADWPADWRQKLAGDDAKTLERLGRMGSPADLLKSYRALEQRLSSGELKKALPENATDEQKAEWRKEMGLPEKADDYLDKLTLPDGIVLGEMDKPVAAAFAEAAHAGDLKPEQYSKLVAKYYELQDQKAAEQAERDSQVRQEAEDALRGEWGQEYRPNLNAVKNLLAGWPEGLADNLLGGRLADGTKIGDSPLFIKALSQTSRELNPAATLVPATGDIGKNVEARLGELKTLMKDRQSDYYKGPKSNALQAEYRQLLDAQNKMKVRAA